MPSFQTSVLDPTYKEAVEEAVKCGVKIVRLQVGWNEKGGTFYYRLFKNELMLFIFS